MQNIYTLQGLYKLNKKKLVEFLSLSGKSFEFKCRVQSAF